MDNADHRFHLMFTLGIANLTLKRRLPPVNVSGGILNLKAFKSAPYTIWCIANFIAFLGTVYRCGWSDFLSACSHSNLSFAPSLDLYQR